MTLYDDKNERLSKVLLKDLQSEDESLKNIKKK